MTNEERQWEQDRFRMKIQEAISEARWSANAAAHENKSDASLYAHYSGEEEALLRAGEIVNRVFDAEWGTQHAS